MKIRIAAAVLTGVLSFIPALPASAASIVNNSAPAAVTHLNARDLMIEGASETATVQLHFAGAERLETTGPGELCITANGSRKHYHPEAYQVINGKVRPLMVSYKVDGVDRVTLKFGAFDASAPIYVKGGGATL